MSMYLSYLPFAECWKQIEEDISGFSFHEDLCGSQLKHMLHFKVFSFFISSTLRCVYVYLYLTEILEEYDFAFKNKLMRCK